MTGEIYIYTCVYIYICTPVFICHDYFKCVNVELNYILLI